LSSGDVPAPKELDRNDELTGGDDIVISSVAFVMAFIGMFLDIVSHEVAGK